MNTHTLSVRLAQLIFANLFYYSVYFCYYSWVSLHFFLLFMGPIVLFQLTFTFIYSSFSKKNFSFSEINGSQTDLREGLAVLDQNGKARVMWFFGLASKFCWRTILFLWCCLLLSWTLRVLVLVRAEFKCCF